MAKTFRGLKFEPRWDDDGVKATTFYPNGYGVSVVNHSFSYGWPNLYEMAILKGNAEDWDICYDTHITEDVLGNLTPRAVTKHMRQVQAL